MDFLMEFVCEKLRDLEKSNDSQEELVKRYKELLDNILDPSEAFSVDYLKAFIKAILSENVSLEISRQLLSSISEKLSPLAEEVTKSILHLILDQMRPRFASFKEQDASMRQQLANIYERNENWKEFAKVLNGAPSETSRKQSTDDSEFGNYLKLTHRYLLIGDLIKAKESLNQASQLEANTKDKTLKIRYKLYEAEILDHQGNFIEAAAKYRELSRETSIDKMEILMTNALICTILASAGEKKKELLNIFFEDEQYQKLPGYSIIKSMHQGKVIRRSELKDFEDFLQPHQKSSIDDSGFSILNRVVMEHNLLLAGKSYDDMTFKELEIFLEIPLNKVGKFVAQMIEEKRLMGHIDHEHATFIFAETEMETADAEETAPSTTRKRRSSFEADSNKKHPSTTKSLIWNAFHIDEKDQDFAICELCDKRIKRGGWSSSRDRYAYNTSNMILHFETHHKKLNYKTYKKKSVAKKVSTSQTRLDQKNESTESLTGSKKFDDLTRNGDEIAQLSSASVDNITHEATVLDGATKKDYTKEPDGAQKTEEESNAEGKSQECHDKDENQNCSESDSRKMDKNPKENELRDEEKLEFSSENVEKQTIPQGDLWQVVENKENPPSDSANGDQHETSISKKHSVEIQASEFNDESDIETLTNRVQPLNTQQVIVWKAIVHLQNMSEFQMIAQLINDKNCDLLLNKLPDSINVVGFVSHEETMKYIEEIQKYNWMESIIVKLSPANAKDIDALIALCSYLKQYECLAVANVATEWVQQIYLMPWLDQVPPVLQSIIGGSIDENFSAILLGIIIRIKDPGTLQGPAGSVVQEKACLREGLSNGLERIRRSYGASSIAGSSNDGTYYYNANMSQRLIDLISGILAANRPNKLTLLENETETREREENSTKIAVSGMVSENALRNLSFIVPQVLGGQQIKFEKVGSQIYNHREEVILKVEKEGHRRLLFRQSAQFKSLGIRFFSCRTGRERHVASWLKLKAKEIKEIGVSARTTYMEIFIDGWKWSWDDLQGMLIMTDETDNKCQYW